MSDRGTGVADSTGAAPARRVPNTAPVAPGTPKAQTGGSNYGPGATDRQHPDRPGSPTPGVATVTDAQAALRNMLDQWGLGGLTSWAWDKLTSGASSEQVIYELRQTNEYKARFAGNVARQAANLTPLSEADYLGYEEQTRQMFSYYGLPKTFFDQPDDFAKFIGGDVSISELHDRVTTARAELDSQPEAQRAFHRLYGVDDGGQLAYFLDESRALPILMRQQEASQIAGAGQATGFGDIDRIQAEYLASMGVSSDQASAGFSQLAGLGQVTGRIIGDTEAGVSVDEQIAAQFGGNAAAQANLSRRQRGRLAAFQQSGGYAPTQQR